MILLDTDHISILQHADSEGAANLQDRLERSSDGDVATTAITSKSNVAVGLSVCPRYRSLLRFGCHICA
jgi:hypothetical protein